MHPIHPLRHLGLPEPGLRAIERLTLVGMHSVVNLVLHTISLLLAASVIANDIMVKDTRFGGQTNLPVGQTALCSQFQVQIEVIPNNDDSSSA